MKARPESPGNFRERFAGRAEAYSKYRPGYPTKIISILKEEIGFCAKNVVADIGSGTGILSELFLRNGNVVYCVEPNEEMRTIAEGRLMKYGAKFVSINGRAEKTHLGDDSVDLVTVGQALHWFDLQAARKEFSRILRKGGYVLTVYNRRKKSGRMDRAYTELIERYAPDRAVAHHADDSVIKKFPDPETITEWKIPNFQRLDLKGVVGRLASASYMPAPGSPKWRHIENEVRSIVKKFGKDGFVTLRYETEVHLARITMSRP